MLDNHQWQGDPRAQSILSDMEVSRGLHEAKAQQRKDWEETAGSLPDERVIEFLALMPGIDRCPGSEDPEGRRRWLKIGRGKMVDAMLQQLEEDGKAAKSTPDELSLESMWYAKMRVFVPPAILRKRHEGFDDIWKAVQALDRDADARLSLQLKKVRTSFGTVITIDILCLR